MQIFANEQMIEKKERRKKGQEISLKVLLLLPRDLFVTDTASPKGCLLFSWTFTNIYRELFINGDRHWFSDRLM